MSKPRRQDSRNALYAATEVLQAMERCMPRYNGSIVRQMRQQATGPRVLDFGAGIGTLTRLWQQQTGVNPEALEVDPPQAALLAQRGFKTYRRLQDVPLKAYDVIYTSNVLEHIADDQKTLKQLAQCLKPGGKLVVYVPALRGLWSELDDHMGHYRRYQRNELLTKVTAAGLHPHLCRYSDSVGVAASLFLRWRGYTPGTGAVSERGLQLYDRVIHPLSRALDIVGLRYIAGKNLLLVAVKEA